MIHLDTAHGRLIARLEDLQQAGRTIPCRGYTGRGSPWVAEALAEQRVAAAACRTCPVLEQCAQYALEAGEPAGVWGGTTTADRAAARTRQTTTERTAA